MKINYVEIITLVAVLSVILASLKLSYRKSLAEMINETEYIKGLGENEVIKYLGVNFNDQITFDSHKVIKQLKDSIDKLVSCSLLYANQKILIINDYIWSKLVYPLQMAPLTKLPHCFLEDVDKIIRNAVKEIIGLPSDTPTSMIYTSKNLRGLSIFLATWEAFLQHYNVCLTLIKSNNEFIPYVRNLESEMDSCKKSLKISEEDFKTIEKNNKNPKKKITQAMRSHLRDNEFKTWSELKSKGRGVELFKHCPEVNKRIVEKRGLTNTEWIQILKMNGQVAPVRANHGRGQDNHCRFCGEIETLGHVLGFCDRGNLLRNTRHNTVRTLIADEFRRLKWNVYEEVNCINPLKATQRIDIIVYKNKNDMSYIIDPTIRID